MYAPFEAWVSYQYLAVVQKTPLEFTIRLIRKTPYRDGTTQVAFDPLDFIARLAALVWPAAS